MEMESPDLLSTALGESGIMPDDDIVLLSEKTKDLTKNGPKNSHFPPMPQHPNQWPGNYPYHPMMQFPGFPFMDKNLVNMMGPEMFANAAMGMAFQNQMNGGYPRMPFPFGLTSKDVNPYYMNGGDTSVFRAMMMQNVPERIDTGEDAEEEEELGRAETYADYMPSKLKIGIRHPDPVVETSSLSSVAPPDVWYHLSIPEHVIDQGMLSALQLEAISYACQKHETIFPDGTRAGYLIGDGTGIGKGRTCAGIIYENYLLGRKRAVWLSVSNDLKFDSERDLRDIGASKIEVHSLNKFKYAKISSKANGSIKKGVIFATYASLIGESHTSGKYKTRLKQLLQWLGDDFDGCLIFDECHKAKNLCPGGAGKPTKTAISVLELQNKLPKARVVYASATGASEPRGMAYMARLGLYGSGTPFPKFHDFISVIERRGVGAMELVAMDMKLRGLYMARQLSFNGVTFRVEEVPLTQDFIHIYNSAVSLWVEALEMFQEAAELMEGDSRMKKTMWGQFWASHQRFFKYLCIASKVKHVVNLARESLKNGKCVVIGLQSTGEARTLDQLEENNGELTDFVSTAKGVFQNLVEKHFPAPGDRKKTMRLLGLDLPNSSGSLSPTPTTSSNSKRKPLRRARQGLKKYCEYKLSDESTSDDEEREEPVLSAGSDFEPSGEESMEDDFNAASPLGSDSERESDFNPFGDQSDSDDPWANRKNSSKRNKGKKRKLSKGNNSMMKKHKLPAKPLPTLDAVEKASAMKSALLQKIEKAGNRFPPNTLDELIDELGGPENVAEMTGRKGRVVSNNDGNIHYESRSENDVPLESLNIIEKQRFMDGEKRIAIISEAASSGISLHSDRRAFNTERRVHITLELAWSSERSMQQFGRTHRSNQVNAPEYVLLMSDLAGERRFASAVAKRLESLGALTHGDRRASEYRDLSQFNIDNKYGRSALETVMRAVMEYETPLVPPPTNYSGDFFSDIRNALIGVAMVTRDTMTGTLMLDKDHSSMSKVLNRILGFPVDLQNRFFSYFHETLEAVIAQAKKAGRYDNGILDIGSGGDVVKRIKCEEFAQKHASGTTKTELHTVLIERGLSWEAALEKLAECSDDDEGFYLSTQVRNNKKTTIFAVLDTNRNRSGKSLKEKLMRVYRPNTGLQAKQESVHELRGKYEKCSQDDAEKHWKQNYSSSATECSHMYWYGLCRRKSMGNLCEVGLRQRKYHVLSGSVLSVWSKVESVLSSQSQNAKLQIVRLKIEELRIVGCLIPSNVVEILKKVLADDGTNDTNEDF